MRRILLILAILLAIGAASGSIWWYYHHADEPEGLVLFGNVDLRQIQLAFNNNERIAQVNFYEGDSVGAGQVMAQLETGRLRPQVENMKALADASWQAYLKLYHGSRDEEKAQARANVQAAKVDEANARRQFERLKSLANVRLSDKSEVRGASQEDIDNAKAAWQVAEAKLVVQNKALELSEAGPRKEEVAEAKARFEASAAQLAYLQQQLNDATLKAPTDAVVRSRLMEPGEMSSPQRPVFSLAVIKKKWVRAYVTEKDMGKVKNGMPASVAVDSFPDRFQGTVGFISPIAEFTPKAVQTEDLRTSLVYEVRINVDDPDNRLRLGMPATVYLAKE